MHFVKKNDISRRNDNCHKCNFKCDYLSFFFVHVASICFFHVILQKNTSDSK